MPEMESGYADVNGVRLYYESAGEGHPVILVHRGLVDRRMWDDQFLVFAREYRVIRFDIRGSGNSKIVPGDYSHHSDLRALMDTLEVEQAHLVGQSFGGSICVDFALEYSDRTTSLVLASAGMGGYSGMSIPVTRYQTQLMLALTRMAPDDAVDLSLRMWVDGPNRTADEVEPEVRSRVRGMMNDALAQPLRSYLPQMLNPPAAQRLKEIKVPTLIIIGDRDVDDTTDIADQLMRGIKGAQKIQLENAGHMVNMEQPAEFNRVVLDFLEEHTPERRTED
jgi:3-oxoadipate enol-lactonase